MIDFTPEARRQFDDYLQRMRRTFTGSRSVAAGDVEQDVLEHVELALANASAPVGADRLTPVLEQLGPPERWLSDEERPMWRRFVDRMMHGPEDWRLPYLSFAITFLMVLFFPIGGVLLLIPAYLVSRAYVELMSDRGEVLGARRWLVVPPIALLMALVAAGALLGPAGAIGGLLSEVGIRDLGFDYANRFERGRLFAGCLMVGTGAWWIVLSGVFAMLMTPFRALFLPLTGGLRRGHAFVLTIAGVVLGSMGAALLWMI